MQSHSKELCSNKLGCFPRRSSKAAKVKGHQQEDIGDSVDKMMNKGRNPKRFLDDHDQEQEDEEDQEREDPNQNLKYWRRAFDQKSGRVYFFNKITRETSWDAPTIDSEGMLTRGWYSTSPTTEASSTLESSNERASGLETRNEEEEEEEDDDDDDDDDADDSEGEQPKNKGETSVKMDIKEAVDPRTGRTYYYDRKTRQTYWYDPRLEFLETQLDPSPKEKKTKNRRSDNLFKRDEPESIQVTNNEEEEEEGGEYEYEHEHMGKEIDSLEKKPKSKIDGFYQEDQIPQQHDSQDIQRVDDDLENDLDTLALDLDIDDDSEEEKGVDFENNDKFRFNQPREQEEQEQEQEEEEEGLQSFLEAEKDAAFQDDEEEEEQTKYQNQENEQEQPNTVPREIIQSSLVLLKSRMKKVSKGGRRPQTARPASNDKMGNNKALVNRPVSAIPSSRCTRRSGCECQACLIGSFPEDEEEQEKGSNQPFDERNFNLNSRKKATQVKKGKTNLVEKNTTAGKQVIKKKTSWRNRSLQLRQAMRNKNGSASLSSTMSTTASSGGGVVLAAGEDLVPCPHCNRTFNQKAADRHIPICSEIRAKPKLLLRGSGKGAYDRRKSLGITSNTNPSNDMSPRQVNSPSSPRRKSFGGTGTFSPNSSLNRRSVAENGVSLKPCPHCSRNFGKRAYDRHVEHCASTKAKAQARQSLDADIARRKRNSERAVQRFRREQEEQHQQQQQQQQQQRYYDNNYDNNLESDDMYYDSSRFESEEEMLAVQRFEALMRETGSEEAAVREILRAEAAANGEQFDEDYYALEDHHLHQHEMMEYSPEEHSLLVAGGQQAGFFQHD